MFDVDDFVQESIESLQNTIDDVAIIACSGGVDSTVAAVIANKAVGDLLHCGSFRCLPYRAQITSIMRRYLRREVLSREFALYRDELSPAALLLGSELYLHGPQSQFEIENARTHGLERGFR